MTISTITPHIQDIQCPSQLRDLPGWLIWRFESHEGEPKPRKVPFYVSGGRRHGVQGSLDDRAKLTTFAAAKSAAARKGFDGVGLALMSEFGITALDFDNCVTADGVLPEVEAMLVGTYSEFSPSGHGVRAFVQGDLGNHKSNSTDYPFGFETFSSKGFVTFTGNLTEVCTMWGEDISPPSKAVTELARARFNRAPTSAERFPDLPAPGELQPLGLADDQIAAALDALDPDLPRSDWLQVGMALHHETNGGGFAFWDDWSAKGSKYPGAEELEKQWSSFDRPHNARPVTARTLVKMANAAGAAISTSAPLAPDFEPLASAPTTDKPPRFPFVQAATFATAVNMEWIVKGVIPRAELGVVYGASGSGKTFWVMDLALAIAAGVTEWRTRRVKQGVVAYVAAEGANGVRTRLRAYAQHHGVDLSTLPLHVLGDAPNFTDDAAMHDLAASIRPLGRLQLLVLDTAASVMPGADENSGTDFGKVIHYCKLFSKMTGALVILIHHSGKDTSKGARGWSGLRAAADVEIEVVRDAVNTNTRVASVTKLKDGNDEGLDFGFSLKVVKLGIDAEGDEISSCVVEDLDVARDSLNRKAPTPEDRTLASDALNAATPALKRDATMSKTSLVAALAQDPYIGMAKAQKALRLLIAGGWVIEVEGGYSLGKAPEEMSD